ncbi:MAG: SGNH/GDSL hydrolase family protein [Syntrophales bacterium]
MKPVRTIEKLRSGNPATIVAIGDSLTQGWMVRKGYLDFLEEMLAVKYPDARFRIVNQGIPGDTAEGGAYRVQEDVIDCRPDCVLIQFALNDAYAGFSPASFERNIQKMIDRIRNSTDAEIVLVTSTYMADTEENSHALEFYRRLERLAGKNSLPIAMVHEYWKKKIEEGIDFRELVQYDLVHPTVEGYRLMAEAVMEVFEP